VASAVLPVGARRARAGGTIAGRGAGRRDPWEGSTIATRADFSAEEWLAEDGRRQARRDFGGRAASVGGRTARMLAR